MKITAAIIAYNEEAKIGAALESVKWVDEIIVVDSGSNDATCAIATEHGARVIQHLWEGFARQKQFAANAASNDWILSLDADERVSEELRDEILMFRKFMPRHSGYLIPRLSFYLGRPIRHGGWYPNHQLRLFDRRKGKWKDVPVHETFELQNGAEVGRLSGVILHFSIDGALHHHQMIGERYAPLAANALFEKGATISAARIPLVAILIFIKGYFLRFGFLDGYAGFCIAWFAAHHAFLKYHLLWEMSETKDNSVSAN